MKTKRRAQRKSRRSARKVRYAVVGLGYIAQAAVLPAFRHATENSELVALISSEDEKLTKLGKRYGVPFLYRADQYEQCLRSGEIDAVYIALPNSMHYSYALAAAQAGVHVLCEKPLCMTAAECEEVIDACDDAGVKLMTAYRLHFEQANLEAVKLVQSGKLGDARVFTSSFSFPIKDSHNIRLKADLGGGPLLDLGIYCVNAARYIFRSEPTEVSAILSRPRNAKFSEVEESLCAVMKFPGERLAQFTVSFNAASTSWYEVLGTKGKLRLEPAFEYEEALKHQLTIGEKTTRKSFPKTDQFAAELTYFSDRILTGRAVEPSGVEGLIDVYILNALYRSAMTQRSIQIEPIEKQRRPNLDLARAYPPVSEPKLVHAAPPAA